MRLRDGSEVADPRLGRLVGSDPRSANYPLRALVRAEYYERTRLWYLPSTVPPLNQGERGSCVGMGVTNELRYTPVPIPIPGDPNVFAEQEIYWGAQRRDGLPGGAYPGAENDGGLYEGTYVTAGLEEARARGYITEYRWAESEPDLAIGLGWVGPAVIGVNWHEGMMDVDDCGYLWPDGQVVGGHCVCVVGFSVKRGDYTIAQSWGGWGMHGSGRARVTRPVMARLLAENGEAAIVTGRARPKATS